MQAAEHDLKERADLALDNQFLRKAVRFTVDRLRNGKAASSAALGDFERWRERGREIRARTIEDLDCHLSRFTDELEARGGHVHFARDAAEAGGICVRIAQERGAKLAVKSKSMVSEEIELNARFAEHGIEALETDLGEWIVQLAHEAPAHIILPCIHKSRGEIRALFEQHGGAPLAEDTATLAGYARKTLREKFLAADIGISGCNFAVAETGSIVMFTNEGNGRLVTTLPRTHVVLMGMERIVPTFADLAVMAELLPRSATGQKLTTYMNVVTGPRRAGEADGPDEMHVVIVDNGRSAQLGDPDFQEILHCIRCGACLNVCPVYRQIGGHAYGSVYPGPIGAVLSPLFQPERELATELADASSLCGACTEACPVKIPIHDMLVKLRERNVKRKSGSRGERLMMELSASVLAHPAIFSIAARALRSLQRWMLGDGSRTPWLARRVPVLRAWSASRRFPAPPKRSFRELWTELEREVPR
ncbi:MAG TPA: LutB/LldF family L-lactate oxidation iron-sulfur protein [Planctomycetota bacterium]|nr:LutB/LldF family L-lactate oxidation iron-sulfur protein [Planctomycetota bacterium]